MTANTHEEAPPFTLYDGPQMIKFGPGEHQAVHILVAERMLTGLAAANPGLFRKLYGAAVLEDL